VLGIVTALFVADLVVFTMLFLRRPRLVTQMKRQHIAQVKATRSRFRRLLYFCLFLMFVGLPLAFVPVLIGLSGDERRTVAIVFSIVVWLVSIASAAFWVTIDAARIVIDEMPE